MNQINAENPELPEYTIKRTSGPIKIDGKLDEADWSAAKSVGEFKFAWYESGKKEQTEAKMLWDDKYLYVSYLCEDAHISATRTERGSSVWLDDCVEVFTAPNADDNQNYFNIEMNVNQAFLEGHHPKGHGTSAKERWRCEGIQIATTVKGTLNDDSDEDSYWILEAAIPFSAFAHVAKHTPPQPGDMWFKPQSSGWGNHQQYSQWSPGTTIEPQYHAPQDFGRVYYSADVVK
ncbi:MAG: carbohydrate-binding family 9-like protein [Planctomycetaceae bacterium]